MKSKYIGGRSAWTSVGSGEDYHEVACEVGVKLQAQELKRVLADSDGATVNSVNFADEVLE